MSAVPKTQLVSAFSETGSYDVIQTLELETPRITSSHDVIVKNKYGGINFVDGYFRKGVYPSTGKPQVFGREASGIVVAVGENVTKYKVGESVAYLASGSFAQYYKFEDSYIPVLKLGKEVSDKDYQTYAGLILQGLTALTFVEEAHKVQKGEYILAWAASGGVGTILVQLAAQRGANVIALASTSEKLEKAKALGAKYVINYKTEDVVARVKEITHGKGVEATFDSVGKDSFEVSLESLARKGSFVSYGNASGTVPPFLINRLSPKNIKLSRPSLNGYIALQEEWDHYSSSLVEDYKSGKVKFEITKVYPLKEYAQAAKDLESGRTTGKLLIEIPQ